MPHTPMVEYEADADLRSALSLLEEWIDVTTAPARVHRPPAQVTPQLPVPPAPAESSLGTGGIVASAVVAAATTAVTFAFFVVLAMAFLPLPARPSFVP